MNTPTQELVGRRGDAHIVLSYVKDKPVALTMFEACAKALALFVKDIPIPTSLPESSRDLCPSVTPKQAENQRECDVLYKALEMWKQFVQDFDEATNADERSREFVKLSRIYADAARDLLAPIDAPTTRSAGEIVAGEFSIWQTGGGCRAFGKNLGDDAKADYLLISSESDVSADPNDKTWIVGRYGFDAGFVELLAPMMLREAIAVSGKLPSPVCADGTYVEDGFDTLEDAIALRNGLHHRAGSSVMKRHSK